MKKILILQLLGCLIFIGFILLFVKAEIFTPTRVINLYLAMGICNIINAKFMLMKPIEDDGNYDKLTGCFNRTKLDSKIKHYEKLNGYVIIFLDLNNLKKMNDTYGHDRGDELLKQASNRLKYWKDYGDVYRIGGDEFLIIIPKSISNEKLKYFINGWDNSQLNRIEDDFVCKFSYGSAIKTKTNKNTFYEIMDQADKNMYNMKKLKK